MRIGAAKTCWLLAQGIGALGKHLLQSASIFFKSNLEGNQPSLLKLCVM